MTASRSPTARIIDNTEANRYEAFVDGRLAGFAQYIRTKELIAFVHTEVHKGHEGQGIGGSLVRFSLDEARTAGSAVLPVCPFYSAYDGRETHRPPHAAVGPRRETGDWAPSVRLTRRLSGVPTLRRWANIWSAFHPPSSASPRSGTAAASSNLSYHEDAALFKECEFSVRSHQEASVQREEERRWHIAPDVEDLSGAAASWDGSYAVVGEGWSSGVGTVRRATC
ncbi:N-acetyltransferase [Streptomyces sp. VRA16 Mangrove soil]|nr:N-acetyltransferase [Streptomyces sp. VRA16 Mangrove soil]